ncbi:MAG TPA: hypothetical protein VGN72_07835 [Tepidisphaeraceae bacterium]|jgi:hypothetical protein|nr:hypothetical protein [Tepidisphaeraceae bacterium]
MLCRTLGFAHPDHLLATLTHEQFEDWIAIYPHDPWGEDRDDLRMARMVWATFAAMGGKKTKKLKESDFLFSFKTAMDKPQTPEQYAAKARRLYLAQGGRIK